MSIKFPSKISLIALLIKLQFLESIYLQKKQKTVKYEKSLSRNVENIF